MPVYRRHYEWEVGDDKQLPKLWGDLQDQADEQRLKDPSIALESVILSPPRTSRSEIGSRWRLSDEELAMRHVFFMADPGYLDQLMGIVRGASPSAHADMPIKPVPSISPS